MSAKREIVGLQYLRGLAAAGVVIDHVSGMTALPKYFGQKILGGALEHGAIGVDLFFLISGFIICTVSLNNELEPTLSQGRFFLRRAERILPLMWLAILSYAALRAVIHVPFTPAEYLQAIFLLPWGHVEPNNIWTLRHEFIFYSLFAVTFISSVRWRRWILAAWIGAPFAYAALALPAEPSSVVMQVVRIFTHPVNVEFGAGLLTGFAWKALAPTTQVRLHLDPMLLLTGCFCGLVAAGAAFGLDFQSVWSTSLTALLCAPILVLGLVADCPQNLVGRFGRQLGDASYSIYLFHPHIISACLIVLTRAIPHPPPWIVVSVVSIIAIAGGIVAHVALERPLLRVVRTALANRSRGTPIEATVGTNP